MKEGLHLDRMARRQPQNCLVALLFILAGATLAARADDSDARTQARQLLEKANADYAGDQVDVFQLADGIHLMKAAQALMSPAGQDADPLPALKVQAAIALAVVVAEHNPPTATVRAMIADALKALDHLPAAAATPPASP